MNHTNIPCLVSHTVIHLCPPMTNAVTVTRITMSAGAVLALAGVADVATAHRGETDFNGVL